MRSLVVTPARTAARRPPALIGATGVRAARVTLAGGTLTLAAHREGVRRPISVGVGDEVRELRAGERCTFELRPGLHAGHQQVHD